MPLFQLLHEGFIHHCQTGVDEHIAVTSRCVVTHTGEILCTFMTQSGLGINDFIPYLARSSDQGRTWGLQGALFPHLCERYSVYISISRAIDGALFLFGARTPITQAGESFWRQETLGILPNELIWSRSTDHGRTWSEPRPVQVPLPGAAETPAPLCVARAGRWLGPYAPHNTFDPNLRVDRRHTVLVISDDLGQTWQYVSTLRATELEAVCAESWVIELSDGRLLATCAMINLAEGPDFPNAYCLSCDGGNTWSATASTGLLGQASAPTALPDGRIAYAYARRHHDPRGVWLAVARPDDAGFHVEVNDIVWVPEQPTQGNTSGKFTDWTDFAFGEPSVTVLHDETLLVAFWCIQPSGWGIRFVKVGLHKPICVGGDRF